MSTRVDIVDGDTWIGIYIDEKCVYEDHSIRPEDLVKLLEHKSIEFGGRHEADLDWLDTIGRFPDNLGDVVTIETNGKTLKEFWEQNDAHEN